MKKLITVITAALLLTAGGCSAGKEEEKTTQIPNPFIDAETITEAKDIAGFDITVPEEIEGYDGKLIQAVKENMIQVIYGDTEHNIYVRKAKGNDDISGDYNVYNDVTETKVNGHTVTVKKADGLVHVASWTDGDYSYCLQSNMGFAETLVETIIAQVQ